MIVYNQTVVFGAYFNVVNLFMPIDRDPFSLYIHLPWCVKKCPYCDFNSHEMKGNVPEHDYISALIDNFHANLSLVQSREIKSIFFGGGTPSLFSGDGIKTILDAIDHKISIRSGTEITLEANPGTIDNQKFKAFKNAGINRLSLGIQSFNDKSLKALGRIHDAQVAKTAIQAALSADLKNFNIDLMYGLPSQNLEEVMRDLDLAIQFNPTHLSWYQLTIEPNTLFYVHKPELPNDELIYDMQQSGQRLLSLAGLTQYEVSAYAKTHQYCQHNLNYWQFGDYLGIGAGAHSKITRSNHEVIRFAQVKNPKDFLNPEKRNGTRSKTISKEDLIFEFMLNALRLTNGFEPALFEYQTGIPLTEIADLLKIAQNKKLLTIENNLICPTLLGKNYLNNLIEIFLNIIA